MRCLECQHENPPGARFCNSCGARLDAVCPACGHANPPRSRFCNTCGEALDGARGPAPARFISPQSYIPRDLAEKIITSRSAVEGERKQVTVLFADLKGSMELLADRDPEEARRILDPVLERMMDAVHRYEGTVNQVLGDGIMALFGAPLAHEDHAVRACYAALRMQDLVTRYAEEVRRAEGVPIQIRVGLNSGEVVVRSIGSDLHMDYTAVGQTTHLAARMEQLAMPGSILITADALRLAEGYVEVKPLGPISVKGLNEPVEVYEVTGASTVRTRLQAAAIRGLTRFVGRQAEIEELRRALEQARSGRGQIVAIVGEPGVGKSRLFYEFVRSHRMHGCLVLESGSVSYGKATPYLPVIELLKSYSKIDARDDTRTIRAKITGHVLTLDEALRETVPALLALLEALPEDSPFRTLDPRHRQLRVLDAVKRLLLRESQVQPVVLVFEDLHWIDADTQSVLDSLVESLPTAPVLLLVNYRPEYHHGWGSKTYYRQLRIDPLPPQSAEELLQAALGDDPGLGPLKRLLIERTEGNPLFLEENMRALVETQMLVGKAGAYRATKPLEGIQVPATIQAVLAARIDRLPPEDKRLLQTASVIGKDFSFVLLHAITDLPEEALRGGLGRLQTAEFLYEAALFPELEYTFKHVLTHEVAYGSLLQERRRAFHARVIEAFEQLYPDRLAEHADRLAHHVVRGEVWSKAPRYFRDVSVGDSLAIALHRWWTGDHGRTIELALRDLVVAANFGNFGMVVMTNLRLGQAYHALGDYQRGLAHLRRNVAELEADLLRECFHLPGLASVLSRAWLVLCLAERGEFADGIVCGTEAEEIAGSAAHAYSLVVAQLGLGTLYVFKGDFDKAIPLLERGLTSAQAVEAPLLYPRVAAVLGTAYARAGRVVEALPLLEGAVERASGMGFMSHQSGRLVWLGEAYLLGGRAERATQLAGQALKLAQEYKERGHEAYARRLYGEIAARREPPDAAEAESSCRQALTLADELGMRPLLAHCHLGLGQFYRRAGNRPEAATHLSAAAALFHDMNMAFWLEGAEAELRSP